MAYTAQTLATFKVPRVFVRPSKLSDVDANRVITSQSLPQCGDFVQLQSKGGVTVKQMREVGVLESDQIGEIGQVVMKEPLEVELNLSSAGAEEFIKLFSLNVADLTATPGGVGLRENRYSSLASAGITMLIYNKQDDPTNETNVPDIDASDDAILLFDVVRTGEVSIAWNNEQNSATLTLKPQANSGTGSARGYFGYYGALTVTP